MLQSPERTIREYQRDFRRDFGFVSQVSDVFQEDEIWPSQCDQVVDVMQQLHTSAKYLHELLDLDSNFSPTIDPLRFRLLISLQGIMKLVANDLVPDIKRLRSECRTLSSLGIRQRRRILYKVEVLLDESRDTIKDTNILLDNFLNFKERKRLIETKH